MKVMLTSFGIDQSRGSYDDEEYLFYRMPPVSFRGVNKAFLPDYELLLLCDSVVLDEASFERLFDDRVSIYKEVAETFKALKSEGRVELVDFSSILHANRVLLDQMLEHDMKVLDQWVSPLRDSLEMWMHFISSYHSLMYQEQKRIADSHDEASPEDGERLFRHSMMMHAMKNDMHSVMNTTEFAYSMAEEALDSSRKRRRKEYRDPLRKILQAYLKYVNANLVISNELQLPFHDWQDYIPFYSTKFLSVGKTKDEVGEHHEQVQKLFDVAFPNLAIRDASGLLKALGDKRIEDLRAMVSDAVAGKVEFDDNFAKAVLSEVFKSERKAARFRNVLGYATLPIGFIPLVGTPAQKAVEEAIGRPVESKIRKKHKWLYMLSEIADETSE